MTRDAWRAAYVARINERSQCGEQFAQETYEAGFGNHDYDDDPAAAADEELSYWTDDEATP